MHSRSPVCYAMGMKRLALGVLIAGTGIGLHFGALALADRLVRVFPSVPDVLVDRLPLIKDLWYGEYFFFLFIACYAVVLFTKQRRELPYILTLIGVFYLVRAVFLLFLPIGAPLGAAPPSERLDIYPYPAHSFFPGGHHGLLILFALTIRSTALRWTFLVGAFLFGIGTLFAKTHYTIDLIAAALLVYGLYFWAERTIKGFFVPSLQ